MSKLKMILLLVTGAVVLWGAPALADQELTVSAAASLTNAFPEIGKLFEKQHQGVKIIYNFAASGPLLQQIAQGAPVDVFAVGGSKDHEPGPRKGADCANQPEKFCEQHPGPDRAGKICFGSGGP